MTVGIYRLCARDLMTRRADTVRDSNSVRCAIRTMVNHGLSALPVVDKTNRCVGVITKTDIIKLAGHLEFEEPRDSRGDLAALFFGVGLDEITSAKVEDIMTAHVLSVTEDDSVTAIADKMLKHEVHHLPVCDSQHHLVGVVSSMDLVRAIRVPVEA